MMSAPHNIFAICCKARMLQQRSMAPRKATLSAKPANGMQGSLTHKR